MNKAFKFIALSTVLGGCVVTTPTTITEVRKVGFEQNNQASQSVKPTKEVRVYNNNFIMQVGMEKRVQANVVYGDGSIDQNLVFYSSDDTVLQIDANGNATALKEGMATLVVQSSLDPSKRTMVAVTVKPVLSVPVVAFLSPESATLKVGDAKRFDARIQMSNGEDSPNIVWKSDNEAIAVVTNGLVTGVSAGETTIYAESLSDPTKRASARITVTPRN